MSRIGNAPVPVPGGVTVTINKNDVIVKGPKGELSHTFDPSIAIRQEGTEIIVERPSELKHHKSLHGLTRALINNMVIGVSEGFQKNLTIEGVGYRGGNGRQKSCVACWL